MTAKTRLNIQYPGQQEEACTDVRRWKEKMHNRIMGGSIGGSGSTGAGGSIGAGASAGDTSLASPVRQTIGPFFSFVS